MVDTAVDYVDIYAKWIKNNTFTKNLGNEWTAIELPFPDRHNDFIEIYAKNTNGSFTLSDDGYIITDLEMSGCDISSRKRQTVLQSITQGLGVKIKNGRELYTEATIHDLAVKKHMLITAMLSINDMFYTSSAHVQGMFYEEVCNSLQENNVVFTSSIQLIGKSGLPFKIDFLIPKINKRPEILINAINNPDKNAARMQIFSWQDSKDNRPADSKLYIVLNDTHKPVSTEIISALESYGISAIYWSDRSNLFSALH